MFYIDVEYVENAMVVRSGCRRCQHGHQKKWRQLHHLHSLDLITCVHFMSKENQGEPFVFAFSHVLLFEQFTWKLFTIWHSNSFLFISRRGTPKEIILDNVTQFKLIKIVIDKAWQWEVINEKAYNCIASQDIKWKFIIKYAPWMAGICERLVQPVESPLTKSIGKRYLTKTQFRRFATKE